MQIFLINNQKQLHSGRQRTIEKKKHNTDIGKSGGKWWNVASKTSFDTEKILSIIFYSRSLLSFHAILIILYTPRKFLNDNNCFNEIYWQYFCSLYFLQISLNFYKNLGEESAILWTSLPKIWNLNSFGDLIILWSKKKYQKQALNLRSILLDLRAFRPPQKYTIWI